MGYPGKLWFPIPGRAQAHDGQGLEHPTGLAADRAAKETPA